MHILTNQNEEEAILYDQCVSGWVKWQPHW